MKLKIIELRSAAKVLLRSVRGEKCVLTLEEDSSNGKLLLQVNNPKTGAYAKTSIHADELSMDTGKISLRGDDLIQAIGDADEGDAEITVLKNEIRLRFGRANIRVKKVAVDEQSELTTELVWDSTTASSAPIMGKDFKAALKRVSYAAAKKDVRYYLCGVLFQAKEGTIHFVATDGVNLSSTDSKIQTPSGFQSAIVCIATVEAMEQVIPNDQEVSLTFCTNNLGKVVAIGFSTESLHVLCPVLDGTYPHWEKVIPDPATMSNITVPRLAFLKAVNRITDVSIAAELRQFIRLKISTNSIKVETPDGESHEEVEFDSFIEACSVAFDGLRLTNLLDTLTGDTIRFCLPKGDTSKFVTSIYEVEVAHNTLNILMTAKI